MEFIVCMLLASILTGGRLASDMVHSIKGVTPPHVEKARLKVEKSRIKAESRPTPKARSAYAAGKPRFGDVTAVYWGDAMADAINLHNKRRQQKADGTRVPLKARIKRFGQLLWQPVGEKTADPAATEPNDTTEGKPQMSDAAHDLTTPDGRADYMQGLADRHAEDDPEYSVALKQAADRERGRAFALGADPNQQPGIPIRPDMAQTAGPTGEAVNYETTVVELEALIERLRAHVDSTVAAESAVQQAKAAVNNSQVSYNPAAAAAASISEHLPALNVDAETVGHTGTVANAMPPNDVNVMFDQLEAMEVKVAEQRANAEAALGSAEAALKTVQEKYGDAHATVAGELAGDSRFLASSAA